MVWRTVVGAELRLKKSSNPISAHQALQTQEVVRVAGIIIRSGGAYTEYTGRPADV